MVRLIIPILFLTLMCGCALFRPYPSQAVYSESVETTTVTRVVDNRPKQKVVEVEDIVQEELPVKASCASVLVHTDGSCVPVWGSYKCSEPDGIALFTDTEARDVRIVTMTPRTGEMLIVPLPAIAQDFCYPGTGKVISNYGIRSGRMHTGVDIKAAPMDTLRAAFAGVVRMSKVYSAYGNLVLIRHYNGLETVYAHNTRNLVEVNDRVEAGQPIALAGRTGRATTEHLHFEVRVAGQAIDPSLLVNHAGRTVQGDTLYFYNKGGAIQAMNSASAAAYFSGSKIGLPATIAAVGRGYSGTRVSAATVPSQEQAAVVADSQPVKTSGAAPSYQYHTVKQGDTLYAISRRYGVSVKNIMALNNLSNPDKLSLGQKIKIKTL